MMASTLRLRHHGVVALLHFAKAVYYSAVDMKDCRQYCVMCISATENAVLCLLCTRAFHSFWGRLQCALIFKGEVPR